LQEKVLQGAAATHLADFAEQVLLRDQERAIRRTIFAVIDSPEALDPVKAAQAWIELRAVYKLVSKLSSTQKVGIAASQRLADASPEGE
jgi:hypothetical protein